LENIQKQYQGFNNTPLLWQSNAVEGLQQIAIPKNTSHLHQNDDFNEKRLGKRVEQFLSFQISETPDIEILAENIQIKDGKQTIGELDVLALKDGKPIHIETVYKFYLFDKSVEGTSNIDKWIGPNRNDSFRLKLNKLKNKQLPLLHSTHTKETLKTFNLNSNEIEQNVHFKAQLYLPFGKAYFNILPLNQNSIYGTYFNIEKLKTFKDHLFYIPKKLDWLVDVHLDVTWLKYEDAYQEIYSHIKDQRSPLVWLRHTEHQIFKAFVTWW